MASLNKTMLIGNLTRDPEVRYTPKGMAVCDISLAINHKYTTEGGEKKQDVTFIDCTAWGKTAELIGQYLNKGSSLYVEGRLTTESWEGKQTGAKRSRMKVTVEVMQFLGGSREQSAEPRQKQDRPISEQLKQRNQPSTPPANDGMDDDLDEIPF
jgi:single-strand DNA-binding protein